MKMAEKNETNERGDSVRKWYHSHSDEYNEARRLKYAADADARERAKERARNYRERRRKGNGLNHEPLFRFVNEDGPCDYGEGLRIPVWTTGQIASDIGATPQMLRNWQKKKWIPESIFPDKHRLYTANQFQLILELADFMKTYRKSPKKYKLQFEAAIKNIKEQWSEI